MDDFFKGLQKHLSQTETEASLLKMLGVYFSNRLSTPRLKAEDLLQILESANEGELLKEKAEKLVKERLKLDAKALMELKDSTNLTDEAMREWMKVLKGLTCESSELRKLLQEQKILFTAALKPTPTPDGYAIDFNNLLYLLEAAYPWVLGAVLRLGVNMDGTQMGGETTTAASLRLLNEELDFRGVDINSSLNEWFFILHYGGDDRIFLAENVFRSLEQGKKK